LETSLSFGFDSLRFTNVEQIDRAAIENGGRAKAGAGSCPGPAFRSPSRAAYLEA
jgi:hypothetical protein